MPGLFRAHVREDCFDHVDRAENVRVEQLPNVGVVRFLHRGPVTVAGIVDQNVDAAEARLCLLHHGADLGLVGDVQGQGQGRVRVCGGDVFQRGGVSKYLNRTSKYGHNTYCSTASVTLRVQTIGAPGPK